MRITVLRWIHETIYTVLYGQLKENFKRNELYAVSAFCSDSEPFSSGEMQLHYTVNRQSGPTRLMMSVMKIHLCRGFTNHFIEVNKLTDGLLLFSILMTRMISEYIIIF